MGNLLEENAVTLAEARNLLPQGLAGKKLHRSTLIRWITRGVDGPEGKVRLEGLRIGSRYCTSREAIARFVDALNSRLKGKPTPALRTPGRRQRAAERAGKRLQEIGI